MRLPARSSASVWSISFATALGWRPLAPPEASEQALNYFRALRKLGVRGSLQIAHTTKNGDAADQRPFGSVYWHHLARMTWFAKRETSSPERPCVRLVNRKTNLTAALSDVRLQFDFGADSNDCFPHR